MERMRREARRSKERKEGWQAHENMRVRASVSEKGVGREGKREEKKPMEKYARASKAQLFQFLKHCFIINPGIRPTEHELLCHLQSKHNGNGGVLRQSLFDSSVI